MTRATNVGLEADYSASAAAVQMAGAEMDGATNGRSLAMLATERARLERLAKSRTLAARVVLRSRIVLMLARGFTVKEVADRLSITSSTVRLWRDRFLQLGVDGLLSDAPGRGRKPVLDAEARNLLVTREGTSLRALAVDFGVSAATVSRWRKRLREAG